MDRRSFLFRAAAAVPALLGAKAIVAHAESPRDTDPRADLWLVDIAVLVERIAREKADPHGIHVEISEASRRARVVLLFTDLRCDAVEPMCRSVEATGTPYLAYFESAAAFEIGRSVSEILTLRQWAAGDNPWHVSVYEALEHTSLHHIVPSGTVPTWRAG